MRAEIRAAKLLGVAEPVRELEAIATATPTSIGKPEFRAFLREIGSRPSYGPFDDAERLNAELIKDVDKLFAPFPLHWRNGWMRKESMKS